MDYERIYREFIADRKAKLKPDGYTERHHILPRSLGGGDEPENLIDLTARDHYFAHCCLAKAWGGKMWSALFAVAAMAKSEASWKYFCRRRMVETSRVRAARQRSAQMTALWASGEFKRKRIYRSLTAEERAKRSAKLKGRKIKPESIAKQRASALAKSPIHDFVNEDGRKYRGNAVGFMKFSGLSQSMVSCLTRGRIIWAKGWMLYGSDRKAIRGRDPTVRGFRHKDGRTFIGTAYEFRSANPHIDAGSVSKVLHGKLGSIHGWKLIHATAPNV